MSAARGMLALCLIATTACSSVVVNREVARQEKPVETVAPLAGTDRLEVQPRLAQDDGRDLLQVTARVSRQCRVSTDTTVVSTPHVSRSLASPWIPWTEGALGVVAGGAGAFVLATAPSLADRYLYTEQSVQRIGFGLVGGAVVLAALTVANVVRVHDSVEPTTTEVVHGTRDAPCDLGSLKTLELGGLLGTEKLGPAQAARAPGGEFEARLSLGAALTQPIRYTTPLRLEARSLEPSEPFAAGADVSLADMPDLLVRAAEVRAAAVRARADAEDRDWAALKDSTDPEALRGFAAAHAGSPWAHEATQRAAALEKQKEVSQRLTTALDAPLDADALAEAMTQAKAVAKPSDPVMPLVNRAACKLGSATGAESQGFEAGFGVLRELLAAGKWPCTPEETNALWAAFRTYFEAHVELRADFEDAVTYLHRWDEVLAEARAAVAPVHATGALESIDAMRKQVAKVIVKVPKSERCRDEATSQRSCAWACDRRFDAMAARCEAGPEARRAACSEDVTARRTECVACCVSGGPTCKVGPWLSCGE